jgi:hypothetical protein
MMMDECEILMPHPLKVYLRGWVCYKTDDIFDHLRGENIF